MSDGTSVTSGTATDADVAQFMKGKAHQDSGRIDTEMRGISNEQSRTLVNEDQVLKNPERLFSPVSSETPDQNWQHMYGQSENEKGEFRRRAEAAEGRLGGIEAELAAIRATAQFQPQPQQGYATGAYQQPQAPQQTTPNTPLFEGRDGDDMIQVQEMERLMRERFEPAINQLAQQQQALAFQAYNQQKQAMGLTPQLEQELVVKYPWLQTVPEGAPKLQAYANLIPAAKTQQPDPGPQQVEAASATHNPTEAAVRRVTYVEGSSSASTEGGMKSTEDYFQEEMQGALTKPFGAERSQAMRAILSKYGMDNVNDMGPEFLTR